MTLSEISIRRPVFAWMLMLGLIVFGGIAFWRMGISQLPDVDFPVINVSLTLDNAAPEIMESDVVDPIEDAIMGIEGIRTVNSTSSQGAASVTVEFQLDRDINVALQEVQTRIAQAAKLLPSNLDPPVITKTNPEDQPILWLMLTSDGKMPLYQQMMYARNTLKTYFSTVEGVGNILLGGYVDPNLRVWLNNKKLKDFMLTSDDIVTTLEDEQLEVPSGRIESALKEYNVRLLGEATNPEQMSKFMVTKVGVGPSYNPIQLGSITRLEEGLADVREISRYNGKVAVGLGVVKQRGSNAVRVSQLIRERVNQIRASLPPGLSLDVRLDTTKFIKESVSELNFTLLLSALLTSVVCFLFLGSWSSTMNVLFAIPTSVVGAFIVLYFMGFTLNTFTLLGLSLAIGIVVDDAIMMLENIVRHAEMGKNRVRAAIEGSNEITFAALAATIAIAAIFVPVIFMQGIIGRFFFQYGITVTTAVLLSLLEALTLTPMRCSQFLDIRDHSKKTWLIRTMDGFMDGLARSYRASLEALLNRRWIVIFVSIAVFVASLLLAGPLRKELIPQQDQSQFLLLLQTPVGSSIDATNEIFLEAENYLSKKVEVLEYFSSIGGYEGNDIVNQGTVYVTLVPRDKRKLSQRDLMVQIRSELGQRLKDTSVFVQDLSLTGFTSSRGYPIEFTIRGPDRNKLAGYTREFIRRLKATGLVSDVNSDLQDGMPEIDIYPDRDKAAARAVSVASMGSAVGTVIGGFQLPSSTQWPQDGHRYDIRVRSEPDEHKEPSDIDRIYVHNNYGGTTNLVALKDVVTVKETTSYQLISRVNRERAVSVFSNVADGKSQQAVLEAIESIGHDLLPPAFRVTLTGSAKTFREAFESLIFALLLGIAVAYMVLASQFNSFIHPVTVLLALPFSVTGAFAALYFAHQSLNLFSMIGLILLMGIVKKNSILLVDFTNQRRDQGLGVREALLDACPVRLRPILMTSVATVAGAIPEALSMGPGAETRIPMALALIGGVTVSTFLTLFVVPCAYSLLSRFERKDVVLLENMRPEPA